MIGHEYKPQRGERLSSICVCVCVWHDRLVGWMDWEVDIREERKGWREVDRWMNIWVSESGGGKAIMDYVPPIHPIAHESHVHMFNPLEQPSNKQ